VVASAMRVFTARARVCEEYRSANVPQASAAITQRELIVNADHRSEKKSSVGWKRIVDSDTI
jgi:hypothetical protein